MDKKIIIAGTCAFESIEQLRETVDALRKVGITRMRASLWKPRTVPGWEGVGFQQFKTLLDETLPFGIQPSTEIGSPDHARIVADQVGYDADSPKIMVWLGSRNQNHNDQRSIGKILSESPNVTLMFKNQMWEDERHWMGILDHIVSGGFPTDRLWICHRGFAPGKASNPDQLRNLPDFEMAMRVKEKAKLPMILDPSHIGGSQEKVINIFKQSLSFEFDGYMIEVHPKPSDAKTDIGQQLSMTQLTELLALIEEAHETEDPTNEFLSREAL